MTFKKTIISTAMTATLLAPFAFQAVQADHHGKWHGIMAALKNEHRTAKFVALDVQRKPGKVIAYAGIKPGMTVLDINTSRGYYSEILSGVVGDKGKVIAHNGAMFWNYIKKQSPDSFKKLTNITELHTGRETIDLAAGTVDVALNVLSYHDTFNDKMSAFDRARVNKSVYNALKVGGTYIVIDHVGVAGSTQDFIKRVHRIDPMIVKRDMIAAGFKFAGESKALHNPNNPADKSWFRDKVRYNTDRFIYKFTK